MVEVCRFSGNATRQKLKEIQMIRLIRLIATGVLGITFLALPFFISHAGSGTLVSVIVEFRDDPGAVYAAKAKQNGTALSDSQLRDYRNGLTAAQNQFLDALKSKGVNFQLQSVNVK